jgi:hypothetical protein
MRLIMGLIIWLVNKTVHEADYRTHHTSDLQDCSMGLIRLINKTTHEADYATHHIADL